MKIGTGIPSMIPGADGETLVKWAQAADSGPFSSLTTIDRICYENCDPLTALAIAAGATRRVKLMTTVLLAAAREPVSLAKQVATLDRLSGGRVVLGVGVGARADDFAATGYGYHNRGRRLEQTIETMRRVWRGEPPAKEIPPVGPRPAQEGGPPILIGAVQERAIARIGRYADGYIGTGGAGRAAQVLPLVHKAWQDAGRSGKPMLVAAVYFALGDEATAERGRQYLRDYYSSFMGPAAEMVAQSLITDREGIKQAMTTLEQAGYDEVSFWPTVPELSQLERLAEIVA